jgi:hypothetical protein
MLQLKRCVCALLFGRFKSMVQILFKILKRFVFNLTIPFFKRCVLEVVFFTTGSRTTLLHKHVTIPFFKRCVLINIDLVNQILKTFMNIPGTKNEDG